MIGSAHAVLSLLAGSLSLALSLLVLRMDWRGEVNRVFSLWSALIAFASFMEAALQYGALPEASDFLTRLFGVTVIFIISLLVHIAYIAPRGLKRTYLKALIHLPAVPLAVLVLSTDLLVTGPSPDPSHLLPAFGPLMPLGVEYLVAYPFLGLGLLLKAYLQGPDERRAQLKLLLGGMAFPVLGNPLILLFHLAGIAPPAFNINSLAMSLLFAYAISTHRVTFRFESLTTSFRNILESLTDGIVVMDLEGRIVHANPAARANMALPEEGIEGKDFQRAFGGMESVRWKESLSPVVEKGQVVDFAGVRYSGPRAKEIICNLKVQPLRDMEGLIAGAVATVEYITEKVRLEEELEEYAKRLEEKVDERTRELRKAYEELKELDRMKEEFINNITHELKTPVTITKASLELAMDEPAAEERSRFISTGMEGVARLERLLDDLLNVSKMEKGAYRLHPAPLELGHAIERATYEISPLAKSQAVQLRANPIQRPIMVMADEEALRRVLLNLLHNGIKFNKGGGEVVVEASVNSGLAEVRVTDTGIGIPKESLGNIFDRFYQVEGGLDRRYPGTGLGLAIAKKLVELQRGQIRVESEVGRGSTFTFTIPLAGE